jgi:hypothetical protein
MWLPVAIGGRLLATLGMMHSPLRTDLQNSLGALCVSVVDYSGRWGAKTRWRSQTTLRLFQMVMR